MYEAACFEISLLFSEEKKKKKNVDNGLGKNVWNLKAWLFSLTIGDFPAVYD